VILRGLNIDGVGRSTFTTGILVLGAAALTIEDCVVRNTSNRGLLTDQSGPFTLSVSKSYFINNLTVGVDINGASTTASFDKTVIVGSLNGLSVTGQNNWTMAVAVTDSVVANSSSFGILSKPLPATSGTVNITVTRSQIVNNGIGIEAAIGTIWLGDSTVTGNTTIGFSVSGGAINTFGDNYIADNGPNNGSLTPVSKQ